MRFEIKKETQFYILIFSINYTFLFDILFQQQEIKKFNNTGEISSVIENFCKQKKNWLAVYFSYLCLSMPSYTLINCVYGIQFLEGKSLLWKFNNLFFDSFHHIDLVDVVTSLDFFLLLTNPIP